MSQAAPTGAWRGIASQLFAFFDCPIDRRLFNIFKAFLALKLYLGPILGMGPSGTPPTLSGTFHLASSASSLILLLACVITITSRSHYKFGLWIFTARTFSTILGTLPMTPNHVGLEFLLLLILLIFPATPLEATSKSSPRATMVDG